MTFFTKYVIEVILKFLQFYSGGSAIHI